MGMSAGNRPFPVGACLNCEAMTTTGNRAEIGSFGEQLAVDHLQGLGLRIVARNWRCRYGELDIIAADDATATVVFVEVKTRTSDRFGGVEQAVTPAKVRRRLASREGPPSTAKTEDATGRGTPPTDTPWCSRRGVR